MPSHGGSPPPPQDGAGTAAQQVEGPAPGSPAGSGPVAQRRRRATAPATRLSDAQRAAAGPLAPGVAYVRRRLLRVVVLAPHVVVAHTCCLLLFCQLLGGAARNAQRAGGQRRPSAESAGSDAGSAACVCRRPHQEHGRERRGAAPPRAQHVQGAVHACGAWCAPLQHGCPPDADPRPFARVFSRPCRFELIWPPDHAAGASGRRQHFGAGSPSGCVAARRHAIAVAPRCLRRCHRDKGRRHPRRHQCCTASQPRPGRCVGIGTWMRGCR